MSRERRFDLVHPDHRPERKLAEEAEPHAPHRRSRQQLLAQHIRALPDEHALMRFVVTTSANPTWRADLDLATALVHCLGRDRATAVWDEAHAGVRRWPHDARAEAYAAALGLAPTEEQSRHARLSSVAPVSRALAELVGGMRAAEPRRLAELALSFSDAEVRGAVRYLRLARDGRNQTVSEKAQPRMPPIEEALDHLQRAGQHRRHPKVQPSAAALAVRSAVERRAAPILRRALAEGAAPDAHAPAVDQALSARGRGEALPESVKTAMEAKLGIRLGGVRIHTDAVAHAAAEALHAQAFTIGDDVFFRNGAFDPASASGRTLLAHELTHVAQFYRGELATWGERHVSRPGDALEREADAQSQVVSAVVENTAVREPSRAAVPVRDGTTGALMRKPAESVNASTAPSLTAAHPTAKCPAFPEDLLHLDDEFPVSPKTSMRILSTPLRDGPQIIGPYPIEAGGRVVKTEAFFVWVSGGKVSAWVESSRLPKGAFRRGDWLLWNDQHELQVVQDRTTDAVRVGRGAPGLSGRAVERRQEAAGELNRDLEHFVAAGSPIEHARHQVEKAHEEVLVTLIQATFKAFQLHAGFHAAVEAIEAVGGAAGRRLGAGKKNRADVGEEPVGEASFEAEGASTGTKEMGLSPALEATTDGANKAAQKPVPQKQDKWLVNRVPTPEERQRMAPAQVLRASGKMTKEEIRIFHRAIKKDAQAAKLDPAEENYASRDASDALKTALTKEERQVLIKAHQILFEDVTQGALARKFIPNNDVGAYLHGETILRGKVVEANAVGGSQGLARNVNGLNAEKTVARLGLDWEHQRRPGMTTAAPAGSKKHFTDELSDGRVVLSEEIKAHGLHHLEYTLTPKHAEAMRVPVGPDLVDEARLNPSSARQFLEQERKSADDPFTGTGATAPNRMKSSDGKQIPAAINQELKTDSRHILPPDTKLMVRDAPGNSGKDVEVAVYKSVIDPTTGSTQMKWVISEKLTSEQRAWYESQILVAKNRADAERSRK